MNVFTVCESVCLSGDEEEADTQTCGGDTQEASGGERRTVLVGYHSRRGGEKSHEEVEGGGGGWPLTPAVPRGFRARCLFRHSVPDPPSPSLIYSHWNQMLDPNTTFNKRENVSEESDLTTPKPNGDKCYMTGCVCFSCSWSFGFSLLQDNNVDAEKKKKRHWQEDYSLPSSAEDVWWW